MFHNKLLNFLFLAERKTHAVVQARYAVLRTWMYYGVRLAQAALS
jgi:hypothetical protein